MGTSNLLSVSVGINFEIAVDEFQMEMINLKRDMDLQVNLKYLTTGLI